MVHWMDLLLGLAVRTALCASYHKTAPAITVPGEHYAYGVPPCCWGNDPTTLKSCTYFTRSPEDLTKQPMQNEWFTSSI